VGGSGRLDRLGNLVRTAPVLAVLFMVPALSLAGIPPLSGFVGKFALIDSGVASREWVVVGVAAGVSLLTLFSMVKIWAGAFWSPPTAAPEHSPHPVGRLGGPPLMVVPTGALVALGLAMALAAGPLYRLSERTANDLLDRDAYVQQVLGP
jgi:multicomponent Na+:H+ antiporter subunit D